jgi:hypothetical protein
MITPSVVTHPFSLDTFTLRAAALYPDGYEIKGKRFTWFSSDTAIATVDSTGRVYTRAQGVAQVVAAVDGVSDTAQITIDPGVPLLNDCLTCHWDGNQDQHLAWGFDVATCDACHAAGDEPHATLRSGHPDASGGFELLGAHGASPVRGATSSVTRSFGLLLRMSWIV